MIEAVIASQWAAMVEGDPHAAVVVLRAVAQACKLLGVDNPARAGLGEGWQRADPAFKAALEDLTLEEIEILCEGPAHLAEPIHARVMRRVGRG